MRRRSKSAPRRAHGRVEPGGGREPEIEMHHDLVVHLERAQELCEAADLVVLEAERRIPTHPNRVRPRDHRHGNGCLAGNAMDGTGYGGPNAYFTAIDFTKKTGTVNFIASLAPLGGTGFFSLEEALTSAISCSVMAD